MQLIIVTPVTCSSQTLIELRSAWLTYLDFSSIPVYCLSSTFCCFWDAHKLLPIFANHRDLSYYPSFQHVLWCTIVFVWIMWFGESFAILSELGIMFDCYVAVGVIWLCFFAQKKAFREKDCCLFSFLLFFDVFFTCGRYLH